MPEASHRKAWNNLSLRMSAVERVWQETDKSTEHWLWTGPVNSKGYGAISYDGVLKGAHVVVYEHFFGPVGDMFVLHKCDTPNCVTPEHLFLGTNGDNMKDAHSKGRGVTFVMHGSHNPASKLTWSIVEDIRRRNANGESGHTMAEEYGVWYTTIRDVINNKTWVKHQDA